MTLLNEVETLRAMRNSFQPRTLAIFGSLGFVVQQLVSMGLCALGLVQTHYDVELGPHTTGWPLPPDRLDRAWIGWVGPALFPMPDSGTGDNGDRGASTGLQEDDRAQQLPFVVEHREQAFIAWRAPRGNLFGRTLGEQWAVVGPIDESYVDAFREFNERYGASSEPVALEKLRAIAGERAATVTFGASEDRAESDAEYQREQAAQRAFEAGNLAESDLSVIIERHELRNRVDAYLRAFGRFEFECPSSLWKAEPTGSTTSDPHALMLRTSAEWGWPFHSVELSALYVWNGTLQPATASNLFRDEESESYDVQQEGEWQAELSGLATAVPKTRADGKPLWTTVQQNLLPLPSRFKSVDRSTFLPGLPWRPIWLGALLNSSVYALGLWCVWKRIVVRLTLAWRSICARRAKRCAMCGYPLRGLDRKVNRKVNRKVCCPECGTRSPEV